MVLAIHAAFVVVQIIWVVILLERRRTPGTTPRKAFTTQQPKVDPISRTIGLSSTARRKRRLRRERQDADAALNAYISGQ